MVPTAMILEVALVLGAIQLTLCDREHKVHNIVLYPERHSWCQTTAIKQVVASPGYESVTIDNNVCVGACYSYSIPRTQPAEPGELIGPYCDSCQPVGTRCYHVTLHADSKNIDGPRTIQKRVQIITNCSCMSCDTVQSKDCEVSDQNTSELPSDLFALLYPHAANKTVTESKPLPPEEVPELLHFKPPKNVSVLNFGQSTNREQRFELNSKLINLLRSIQDEGEDSVNFNYDKEQLKQLLQIIEGSEHELSDKNLIDFINFVNIHNSEDFELDLSRLKDVLTVFKKDEDLTLRHRNFGLGSLEQAEENNAKINQDLENLSITAGLPNNFGIEGSHHGLAHAKGSHIGMGLQPNNLENSVNNNQKSSNEETTAKGHHHLGEPQHIGLDIGHLVRGPHGSLAFAPDIKPKLNLEPDMIKPNHEGVVISYENHPKSATID